MDKKQKSKEYSITPELQMQFEANHELFIKEMVEGSKKAAEERAAKAAAQ